MSYENTDKYLTNIFPQIKKIIFLRYMEIGKDSFIIINREMFELLYVYPRFYVQIAVATEWGMQTFLCFSLT